MKVTRYGQSCLVLEKAGRRLAVDPGSFFSAKHQAGDLGKVEAVLYTHLHGDHFDGELVAALEAAGAVLYGPSDLAEQNQAITPLEPANELDVAGFKVKAVDLPHCAVGPSARPYNLGYVFDGQLLHPGDSSDSAGLQVEVLAVPILGPDISPYDAINQINAVGAKLALPIHYDMFGADPSTFQQWCSWMGASEVEVRVLDDGESTELNF